ncbi:MAG: MBL fold metallo-hydrolase [Acidobacteria bacterium]|nr:MBL fold metallo-hydrolase [Acidobacteriota bacterium]
MLPLLLLGWAQTQVVLLGTGTPNADPLRSGPSTAVVVNGASYVVDLGPGVVRRAAAAAEKGVKALAPANLKTAFLTHLHSDHTAGLSDFYLMPAVLDRHAPLTLIGPRGTRSMANHIRAAYKLDIENRIEKLEKGDPLSYRIDVTEIRPGVIYKDANVTVTAITVEHAGWDQSFAFHFQTPDKRIVISGDTVYNEAIAKLCNGCDVLVHEVYSELGLTRRPEQWQKYHKNAHTSGPDVGRIAAIAKPKMLVLTHLLLWGVSEDQLSKEIRSTYSGPFAIGKDLDIY